MLLKDLIILEDKDEKEDGAYIAVKFSDDSNDRLHEFATKLDIPNIVPKDKYHITVIYSTKSVPKKFKAKGKFKDPLLVQPNHLTIFPTSEGNGALVLELYSAELVKRHKELMKKYDLKYDFDEYKVHVTMSYDVGDEYKIDKDASLKSLADLEVAEEYYDKLNKDWVKDNT